MRRGKQLKFLEGTEHETAYAAEHDTKEETTKVPIRDKAYAVQLDTRRGLLKCQ